jgi:hypothetical protein
MSALPFVCALRGAFAQLAAAPLSAVRLVGTRSGTGATYPVIVSQTDSSCTGSRRLHPGELRRPRLAQSLTPLTVEASVDVSQSTIASPSGSAAEEAVKAAITAVFNQNPGLVDTLFTGAILAACSAQGIAQSSCPQPPSLIMTVSAAADPAPAEPEAGSVVMFALMGALGCAVCVAVALAVMLWRERSKRRRKVHPVEEEAAAPPDANHPSLVVRHVVAEPPPSSQGAPVDAGRSAGFSRPPRYVITGRANVAEAWVQ